MTESRLEPSLRDALELRALVDVLYDVQEVRMRTENRLRSSPKETRGPSGDALRLLEKTQTDRIEGLLAKFPIYTEWLYHVKGIGPRLSGSIISHIAVKYELVPGCAVKEMLKEREEKPELGTYAYSGEGGVVRTLTGDQLDYAMPSREGGYIVPFPRGIGAFDTVSRLWMYWGLGVVNGRSPKRTSEAAFIRLHGREPEPGELALRWSPALRTLSWKIADQFVKTSGTHQGHYGMLYAAEKAKLTATRMPLGTCSQYEECRSKLVKAKHPSCVGHIDTMAKRKAVKRFLAHLWEKWRTLEGLPIRAPYVAEKLGHTGITSPDEAMQK